MHFENAGKAHEVVVITRKYSKFLNSGRVISMVQIYVDTQGYIYVYFRKDIYEYLPELQKFYVNATKVLGLKIKKISVQGIIW